MNCESIAALRQGMVACVFTVAVTTLCACSSPQKQCGTSNDCTQAGFICVAGVCRSSLCDPACPSSQQCDQTTVTCKDVTQATVSVTSPGEGAFVGVILQATATARAP